MKTIANMATFPARQSTLRETLDSVSAQVDHLNLCLNEYADIPRWLSRYKKVHPFIPDKDLKDVGKFAFETPGDANVFLLDDDIPYPPDYVRLTLSKRDALPQSIRQRCVVGYHGTIYRNIATSRFVWNLVRRRQSYGEQVFRRREIFSYFGEVPQPLIVSQLGTGTVLLKGHQLPDFEYMLGSERRVDVRFARWSQERAYPHICLNRSAQWIPRRGADDDSIWGTYTKHAPRAFVREILSFAFKVPNCGDPIETLD